MVGSNRWGYLRENKKAADKAGIDLETKVVRTSLKEYLDVIFPNIDPDSWVANKCLPKVKNVDGTRRLLRPDYRSDILKLIVEFDGLQHFKYPKTIRSDLENTKYYQSRGYKVVRIPYFIQLTNEAVVDYFEKNVEEKLFDGQYHSLTGDGTWMPASLCTQGLIRMALEFVRFPAQYDANRNALLKNGHGVDAKLLDWLYRDFRHRYKRGIPDPAKLLEVVTETKIGIVD